jgi:hypothetical protein
MDFQDSKNFVKCLHLKIYKAEDNCILCNLLRTKDEAGKGMDLAFNQAIY